MRDAPLPVCPRELLCDGVMDPRISIADHQQRLPKSAAIRMAGMSSSYNRSKIILRHKSNNTGTILPH
jgi:hypothetical protein